MNEEFKIDIGSGYKKLEGFVTLDADENCKPDLLCNLEIDIIPLGDDTVDYIRAVHILEHLGAGYFHCLQELYRVAKDGCVVEVIVPYHFHENFWNDPTHQRAITVEGLKMFSKKYNQETIRAGTSHSTLGLRFNVDFELLDFKFIPDEHYREFIQSATHEQATEKFRSTVNSISEVHMRLIVVK